MLRPLLASLATLGLLVAPLHADGEESVGWTDLDAELERLSRAPQADASDEPISFWGFGTFIYAYSGDLPVGSPDDLGGFLFDALRIYVDGQHDNVGYRVSADAFSGTLDLVDAYAHVDLTDELQVVLGRFRTPFLRSALVEENRYVMLAPTYNAVFYRVRDASRQGVMMRYDRNDLHAQLAVQDGFDQLADEHLVTARVSYDIVGAGIGPYEGAYDAPDGTSATLGAAWSDDGAGRDGTATALEAALTHGRFALQIERVDYEADYTAADLASGIIIDPLAGRGDTSPLSVTLSHILDADQCWEIAARYDEFDDQLERELITLGVNKYIQGHDIKLGLNFSTEDSVGDDVDLIALGASLSF
jgi:hypothetical protein